MNRPDDRRIAVMHRLRLLPLAFVALLAGPVEALAQDLHPSRRPSPIGIARTHVGDTYVKVTYGRPYMRNRDIFGTPNDTATYLVPWGEVWRTGANEATELTTTGPITVAGQRLPAGTYSIFTVPGRDTWSIRFSPILGLDGTNRFDEATEEFVPGYDESRDVLRVDVPAGTSAEDVDQFTMELERTAAGADLVLSWERTEVRVPIAAAR